MKINTTPRLLPYLVASGALQEEPFSLVDVGASGGIEPHWRCFGGALRAVGFDMLVNEVDRLNQEEQNPQVRYCAGRVGYARYAELIGDSYFSTNIQERSSSRRALELLRVSHVDTYDQTHTGVVSSDLIELDEYFLNTAPADIDFIKTDADSHDYEVLLGSKELLVKAPVMGLLVEAPFSGGLHPAATLFANVDVFLRNRGFSLYDFDLRRYSRASLPKPFRWMQPCETESGQLNWADCLYLRDIGIEGYEEQWKVTLSVAKLLKLCCLHELFGLEDCAAEVLLKYRDSLSKYVEVEACLDLLTPALPDGKQVGYREYIAFFENNVEAFYSGR